MKAADDGVLQFVTAALWRIPSLVLAANVFARARFFGLEFGLCALPYFGIPLPLTD
jgi:hypothetical protein